MCWSRIGLFLLVHAPISQYLLHPRILILEVDVGAKLIIMVTSMNCLRPHIENLSICQVTQKKRPIVQTTIVFVGEHNYEWPHTNDDILDIEGQHPTKQIVTKCWGQNIITTLHRISTLNAREGCNDDDDDNDTDILDEAIEAPNDSDYHELWPRHPNLTINHPPRSWIKRAS
jgi:hypothetical protein